MFTLTLPYGDSSVIITDQVSELVMGRCFGDTADPCLGPVFGVLTLAPILKGLDGHSDLIELFG